MIVTLRRAHLGLASALVMVLALCVLSAHPARASVVATDNVEAELIASRLAIAPGQTIDIALRKTIRERWHTYWINPGDAGEPTRVTWTAPPGVSVGDIEWPTPKAITLEDVITNYGYEGELVLPMTLTAAPDLPVGEPITLVGEATWLVCEDICIPESATLSLTLDTTLGSPAPDRRWSGVIADARASIPQPSGFAAGLTREGDAVRLTVASPALGAALSEGAMRAFAFFPYAVDAIDHNAPQPVMLAANGLAIDLKPAFGLADSLRDTAGVLTFEERRDGRWTRRGVEVSATAGAPAAIGAAIEPQASLGGGVGGGLGGGFFSGGAGLLGYLIGAFIGGLILNLMPCVFPVLSIKALSFAKVAHEDPGVVRRQGLVFLAGVLVSFLVLASALIALKAAGQSIGWGFQLQSPIMVGGLALLTFAVGLNLMGVFEIGAGLQGVGGGLAAKDGDAGAFFTGVLAVLVATPCTAPFMGAALGFALVQPALVALAVFGALGLGLAAPFVILSFAPGLLRALPRPGPWMETLKQFFAFPMFATSVWLVWVLAQQAGANGVLAVLAAITALAFAIWAFKAADRGRGALALSGRVLGGGVLALALAGLVATGRGAPVDAVTTGGASGASSGASQAAKLEADAWSPQRVADLRSQGRLVFVDFTAAWCITCQFNKRVALNRANVKAAFAAHDVTFLTADWTNRDSVIARELESHGRSGVPLYLLYGATGEPQILPQLLTESLVIEAVRTAASAPAS